MCAFRTVLNCRRRRYVRGHTCPVTASLRRLVGTIRLWGLRGAPARTSLGGRGPFGCSNCATTARNVWQSPIRRAGIGRFPTTRPHIPRKPCATGPFSCRFRPIGHPNAGCQGRRAARALTAGPCHPGWYGRGSPQPPFPGKWGVGLSHAGGKVRLLAEAPIAEPGYVRLLASVRIPALSRLQKPCPEMGWDARSVPSCWSTKARRARRRTEGQAILPRQFGTRPFVRLRVLRAFVLQLTEDRPQPAHGSGHDLWPHA
jgi:hypothetical protein